MSQNLSSAAVVIGALRVNKGTDQTGRICRLVCHFVVHMQQSQVFSWQFTFIMAQDDKASILSNLYDIFESSKFVLIFFIFCIMKCTRFQVQKFHCLLRLLGKKYMPSVCDVVLCFCHFLMWCPGSGVVLDYIDFPLSSFFSYSL